MVTIINMAKCRLVKTPLKANPTDAGIDFFIPDHWPNFNGIAEGDCVCLKPGEDILIPSGIQINVAEFLDNTGLDKNLFTVALIAMEKSGRATKDKLTIGARVLDEEYQGEFHLHVFNNGLTNVFLRPGEKILQGLLLPVLKCEINIVPARRLFKTESNRGTGGMGSTGLK